MTADHNSFERIAQFLRRRVGITLASEKHYLLETRLTRLLGPFGFSSIAALVAALEIQGNQELELAVIEAMTTNETHFFRDGRPFDALRGIVLPELLARPPRDRKLRILCAAASTGQEPYSIAIILSDAKCNNSAAEIIATDIDRNVLTKAQKGIYSSFEVQRGVPSAIRDKYFIERPGDQWEIRPTIRSMVEFRQWNLMDDMAPLGQFDIVFCRNVLIYFDVATKEKVIESIANRLRPNGFLFVGAAETLVGLSERFTAEASARGLYRNSSPAEVRRLAIH